MDRSAIILAEISQGKFSEDMGLLALDSEPLLNHIVDKVKGMVGEVVVVTSSKEQSDLYAKIVSSANVRFVVGVEESDGSLAGALAGLEAAQGEYSLLLPFDTPFVSREVVSLLFDCCVGKSAVVPRWPDHQIEPLQAVYHTVQALEAGKKALTSGEVEVEALVCKMRGVRFLSTLVIEQLDPNFRTFFKVKSPSDLKKALAGAKRRETKSQK